jgi:AraC-like DNA-binding protein
MRESPGLIPNPQTDQAAIRIEDRRRFQDFRVEMALLKSSLSIYERMVYVVLCSFASREGECFPSVGTIAKSAGCSERQVQRALQKLEEIRVVRKSPAYRSGTSGQLANTYTLVGFRNEAVQSVTPKAEGGVTTSHRGGDCQSPQVLPDEPREKEKIPDTLYPEAVASAGEKGADAPGPSDTHTPYLQEIPYPEKLRVSREQVPPAFRETFDLFLLKTGRKEITREELALIEALEKIHIPSRVQAEITGALDRFRNPKRLGCHPRDPSELTWHYLWDALKNQKSGKALQEEKRRPPGGRRLDPKWLKQLETWEKGT